MQKYVVIGLTKLSWSNTSDKLIQGNIFVVLWRGMYMVSIREEIIPNPPFQSPGKLLVILSVSSNMDFGDTREVSLIDTQCIIDGW